MSILTDFFAAKRQRPTAVGRRERGTHGSRGIPQDRTAQRCRRRSFHPHHSLVHDAAHVLPRVPRSRRPAAMRLDGSAVLQASLSFSGGLP